MSDQKNPGHNSKRDFLKNPVEHIDITSFDSRKIISSMEKMSFVSRETANAANIYNEMLKDKECTIFLTLAGSTSAAGCMNIYKDLVKYNMVDAIVATGSFGRCNKEFARIRANHCRHNLVVGWIVPLSQP
jgi:deoxyhypusine synthase